jgi:hypothetical protein
MKAVSDAAMAIACFVLIVVIDALLNVNRYPQG